MGPTTILGNANQGKEPNSSISHSNLHSMYHQISLSKLYD